MSKRSKDDKEMRILNIFNLLKQGKTADQIDQELAMLEQEQKQQLNRRKQKDGDIGQKKGRGTERRMADLLATVPCVSRVHITQPNSHADRQGIDLFVKLQENIYPFTHVYVQVKSSTAKITEFRAELKKKRRQSEGWLKQYLLGRRFILLSGDRYDGEIVESFYSQLMAIDEYYRERK